MAIEHVDHNLVEVAMETAIVAVTNAATLKQQKPGV